MNQNRSQNGDSTVVQLNRKDSNEENSTQPLTFMDVTFDTFHLEIS